MKKIILFTMSMLMFVTAVQPCFGMEGQGEAIIIDVPGEDQPDMVPAAQLNNANEDAAEQLQPEGQPRQRFNNIDPAALTNLSNNADNIIRDTAEYRRVKNYHSQMGWVGGVMSGLVSSIGTLAAATGFFMTDNSWLKVACGGIGFIALRRWRGFFCASRHFLEQVENNAQLNHAEKRKISKKYKKNMFKTEAATTALGLATGITYLASKNNSHSSSWWFPVAIACGTYAIKSFDEAIRPRENDYVD